MENKKKLLLSRFSLMKKGLSRVLNTDENENANNNKSKPVLPLSSSLTKSLTLTLSSDTPYHNSEIIVSGCPHPKELPCIVRWYKCSQNEELCQIYSSNKSLQFHPNVQDSQHKILCQWFPVDEGDDTSTLLPSKLAEIGPLKRNPALVQDAQLILDRGKGEFDIIIPKISKTEKQKLIIEGTKIHIHIESDINCEELKSCDFDLSELDVTMNRYLQSLNEEDIEEDTVWIQTYRIKPEYKVHLSRDNLLQFEIENGKNVSSIMLKANASTMRERDILCIVIEALADAKRQRKERKKRSQDLVAVSIDVLDDTNCGNKHSQIQKLQLKLSHIHSKMIELQKVE